LPQPLDDVQRGPFLDRFDAAAKAGFTAVEFLFPYDHPADAVGERLHKNGLTQALFNLPPATGKPARKALPRCRRASTI